MYLRTDPEMGDIGGYIAPVTATVAPVTAPVWSTYSGGQTFMDWLKAQPAVPDEWRDGEGGGYAVPGTPLGMNDYYKAISSGAVKPSSFNDIFSGADRMISDGEFSLFSPATQAWAQAHPQEFMQAMLANRNSANGDLASVGAEGGFANLGAVTPTATGLDYSKAGYMNINDEGGFESFLLPALAIAGMMYGLPTEGLLATEGAGAGLSWGMTPEMLSSMEGFGGLTQLGTTGGLLGTAGVDAMNLAYGLPEVGASSWGMTPEMLSSMEGDVASGMLTGANAGSGAMEWTDFLGDASIEDIAGSSVGYGQSMATAAELAQMQAQYPDWYNALTGVTDIGVSPSNIWNAFKAATGGGSGSSNLLSGVLSGLGGSSNLLSGGLSALGGYLSGNATRDAANTMANAQLEAARIAAEAAKFKPIGITTRFGSSNFQKDAQGNVIGAGYALTPEMKAQQDALMGMSNQALTQYQNAPGMFAPMGQAGQRAMTLGNQYLAADPQAQAMKYMQDQQALLATGRSRDTSNMLTGEFNRGTYGLATGATGQMGAANPRLEALYNAQRQQDLGLAAQATQGGMDYAKFGAGMVGTGGDLIRGMFSGQTAAYDPYRVALGGAQYLEGLGQQPLTMGIDIGKQTSNAASGGLLAQGMNNAAQTMQPANAYSPWGTAMMNAGSSVANYQNQQQQQQQQEFQNAIIARQFGMTSGGI